MVNNKINVGIIGYGVVGKGTVQTLIDNKQTILDKTGIEINVLGIADNGFANVVSDKYLDKIPLKTTSADELIANKSIDIIVELIGGYTFAKKFILDAIKAGKHVVTANKALLALHGKEIFEEAKKNNVVVGFEASVAGGIPIIRVLKEDLVANNILELTGIINGTANYILTRMEDEGKEYSEVLKDAQSLGYAEANPSFDVDGIDTAHKITILSSIAFCTWIDFSKVYIEGISKITSVDVAFAKELGCRIKLLAIAKQDKDGIEVRVHPTMIPCHYQLSSVRDVFNAVLINGDKVGTTLHYGRGAGSVPTGSAVSGDIVSIARDIVNKSPMRVPSIGFINDKNSKTVMKDILDTPSAFYMRFNAFDTPGVLSNIAGILANQGISITSAIQRGVSSPSDVVPLVFMTHKTTGRAVARAVAEIEKFNLDGKPIVEGKTVVMRVEGVK